MKVYKGVNLSGWLLLEPWITPDIFASTGANNAEELQQRLGAKAYFEVYKNHVDTFINEEDFLDMRNRGINAVRIPIPWYIFGDGAPASDGYPRMIRYLDAAFSWAEIADIQVLLDLALVPGSKPCADGLKMQIAINPQNRQNILEIIDMLAERYGGRSNLLGIEPLGEVQVSKGNVFFNDGTITLPHLRGFYRDAYETIRKTAGDRCKVVLSAAGEFSAWRFFMASRYYQNVWLDVHLYHFSDQVNIGGPSGSRLLAKRSKDAIAKAQTSGLPVVVGEWSAALPISDTSLTPEGKIALERQYVASQLVTFETCAGWFFQTWKTDTHLSGWDARSALSSFEKDMLD